MSLVIFTNPRDASTYEWEVNPVSEQPVTKQITIERTSNTGNVGATKQQGDDGPLILDFTGNVFSTAMEIELWQWRELSRVQTIYLTDWDGEQSEGQIILLSRQRQLERIKRVEYAIYECQFEIYRLISGVLASAGVTP